MSIGQRIKNSRKALGLSQAALAGKVGLTQATLSDLENDKSKGSGKIASIASALRVRSFWLETGRGSPEMDESDESASVEAISNIPLYTTQGDESGRLTKFEDFSGNFGALEFGDKCYGMRIKGDPFGDRVQSGDILIADRDKEIFPGDLVIAEISNGEKGVWRLRYHRDQEICFDIMSGKFSPLTFDASEVISMHKISAIIPR